MSIELRHVLISFAFMGFVSAFGFLYSYLLVSKGLWAEKRFLPGKRKEESYLQNLPLILINLACAYGLTGAGMYYFHDLFIGPSFFGLDIPLPLQVAVEVSVAVIIDDAYFYFLHRWLHTNKFMYQKVHRIHHRNRQPTPMEYIYTHPLEWLLGMGGLLVAFFVLQGIAFESFVVYLFWRTGHELAIHSGLKSSKIVRLIPYFGTNEHHELHHAKYDCNYAATFTIWDKIFGTEIVE